MKGEGNNTGVKRICPICGKTYTTVPSVSRTDNRTLICPDCGVRQALESFGISKKGQDRILEYIHGRD